MKQTEAQQLGSIWLEASLIAHDFIQPDYWRNNLNGMVTKYIPGAETYVDETNNEINGFISIVNDDTIAAIFVNPTKQGLGIGGKLINFVKEKYEGLSLTVYSKNAKSRSFYEKHGFVNGAERIDEAAGEREVVMKWTRGSDEY